jgi:hypothetical protein
MMFTLHRVPATHLRPTVERYHYLGRWPDPRSLPFGYALHRGGSRQAPDGRPWALCVFKKLQHHSQKGLFGFPGLLRSWAGNPSGTTQPPTRRTTAARSTSGRRMGINAPTWGRSLLVGTRLAL